jgi:hypothetical protein
MSESNDRNSGCSRRPPGRSPGSVARGWARLRPAIPRAPRGPAGAVAAAAAGCAPPEAVVSDPATCATAGACPVPRPAPAGTVRMTADQALDLALSHYRAGRLDEAEIVSSARSSRPGPTIALAHNLHGAVQLAQAATGLGAVRAFQKRPPPRCRA